VHREGRETNTFLNLDLKGTGNPTRVTAKGPVLLTLVDPAKRPTSWDLDLDIVRAFGAGSIGIAKFAPTADEVGLAQLIGELRSGDIPRMPGSMLSGALTKGERIRASADEYLNFQFGLVTSGRAIHDLVVGVLNSRKVIEQLYRDNGHTVRRRGLVSKDTTGTIEDLSVQMDPSPYLYATSSASTQTRRVATSEHIERWFSGRFRYHIGNEGSDFLNRLSAYEREARIALGLNLGPGTWWELTKFSWLVDYFIDVGSVLRSLELFSRDGLVMTHGYAMVHHRKEVTIPFWLQFYREPVGRWVENTWFIENKVRVQAQPFGFDVNLEGLTVFQNSILAALGISRFPRSLLR